MNIDHWYFWRWKDGSNGKVWNRNIVCEVSGGLVRLGRYHRDPFGNLWIDPNEVEWREDK